VITLDGPGGSGKGTIAWRLARQLGWNILDSGALYRLTAMAALDAGVSPTEEPALVGLAESLRVEFSIGKSATIPLLAGKAVSDRLRSEEVSAFASQVATIPAVRAALVGRQRAFRRAPGLVADGRDMGTVIFPDAELKIFLTASAMERAKRRHKQLKEKGESVNLSRLFRDIEKRDERDRTRSVAPLKPAKDAHVIDSTELTVDEVLNLILKLIEKHQVIQGYNT
jgi:cytidylate kinase